MAFSYMKSKTKPIFSNASTSFRENGVSRLFQNSFKPHLPQTPFAGTSFTRFYMVSAATVVGGARRPQYSRGGFMGGARRIERVPYSNTFHLTLSRRLEKDLGDYEWPEIFVNGDSNFYSILPSSDPRSIRVQSIARKLLDSMREGLMLQQQFKMVAPKSQDSRLLNFGANRESKNHTRNLIWKPATKYLDGKAWEVYVTEYGNEAFCLDNGKIAIGSGLLKDLKSDDEVAAVIAHEIGHAVGRHFAGRILTFSMTTLGLICFAWAVAKGNLISFLVIGHGFMIPTVAADFFFERRREAEADYIALMLMASAGYDPQAAPHVYEKDRVNSFGFLFAPRFSGKKRARLLKKPKTMEQAKQVLEQVKAGNGVPSFV
ncbi:Peptidase M48 [Corchorus olitorius]|uniref:Peptidase M48 n=1 Tax=Corchorus olitorius TaxID=93759 RepID=A0A1R3GVY2_9ROSI|nr:Peptidase M48 [Corchorus olitorius]